MHLLVLVLGFAAMILIGHFNQAEKDSVETPKVVAQVPADATPKGGAKTADDMSHSNGKSAVQTTLSGGAVGGTIRLARLTPGTLTDSPQQPTLPHAADTGFDTGGQTYSDCFCDYRQYNPGLMPVTPQWRRQAAKAQPKYQPRYVPRQQYAAKKPLTYSRQQQQDRCD